MNPLRPDDPESLLAQSTWLRRLVRGLVYDESAADDVVQDTWIAALRAKPADLRAWTTVVARNFARRNRRDAGLRAVHEPKAARTERIEGPDEIVERVELQRKLAEALLALDEPFRSALVLRFLHGLSTIQVAERLGCSHDAARQRISRGLAKLRERLDRDHERGRAEWMSALVPLAHTHPVSVSGGLLIMGTKTKVAVALAVAALGLWLWKGALEPNALEPDAQAASVGPVTPEPAHEVATAIPLEAPEISPRTAVVPPTVASRIADPAPPNGLRGIVLDASDRPIAGALVVASSSLSYDYTTLDLNVASRRERARETHSDSEGRFELPLDPARCYQLDVDKPGFAPATLGRRRPGETVVVRLLHGASLEGRVTQGESQLPVANARVRCFLRGNDSPDGARFENVTVTDDAGRYHFDTLPPRLLCVEVSATGLPASGWIEVHPEVGKSTTQDVNLVAGVWFHGHVLDARTRVPIVGAELGTSWVLRNTVRTDSAGAFLLPREKGSDGQIYVRAAGYGFRNVVPPESPNAQGFEILLEPARGAHGRVTDEKGGPIEGAYVAACGTDYGDVQRHDWVGTTTDDQGRYAITDLRPDLAHSLFVRAQGFGTCVYEFPATEMAQAVIDLPDVVLRPAGAIRGRVVDDQGRPLPDLDVQLRGVNADRSIWNARNAAFLDSYVGARSGRTDDRGAFAFDELATGNYVVELNRDGHRPAATRSVSLSSGERREDVDLVLASGVTLSGRVHDRDGHGLRGVNVSIEPTVEGLSDCDVRTVDDGTFTARGLVPGLYRIQLWPGRVDSDDPDAKYFVHASFERQVADGTELDLQLEEGVWLRGTVVEADGSPLVGARVLTQGPDQGYREGARTDSQGRFRVGVERDQHYAVMAQRPLGEPGVGRGQRWDSEDAHCGRLSRVLGGGAEVRIVMPAH